MEGPSRGPFDFISIIIIIYLFLVGPLNSHVIIIKERIFLFIIYNIK